MHFCKNKKFMKLAVSYNLLVRFLANDPFSSDLVNIEKSKFEKCNEDTGL